jgi:hypothetical protein
MCKLLLGEVLTLLLLNMSRPAACHVVELHVCFNGVVLRSCVCSEAAVVWQECAQGLRRASCQFCRSRLTIFKAT